MKPLNWYDIYPQGTTEGDEENAFFTSLSRDKYVWKSTSAIAKEAAIQIERVEEIIQKYLKYNIVIQSPTNVDNWGYWDRVPKELLPKKQQSIVDKDHTARRKKI